jgi:hypothetical protein
MDWDRPDYWQHWVQESHLCSCVLVRDCGYCAPGIPSLVHNLNMCRGQLQEQYSVDCRRDFLIHLIGLGDALIPSQDQVSISMIPPVWTIPVWGRARSGLDRDWTGLNRSELDCNPIFCSTGPV